MNALVKAPPQFKPPAAFANIELSQELFGELAGGVTAGFPIISYRGKVWRVRKSGTEQNYLDANNDAVQSIEIVLVKSNPRPSKSYYDKAFEEGSTEAPRCWSTDGLVPDASVTDPINPQCASCPMNAWGSGRPTPSGKKSRACADVRRMAVAFAHEIEDKGEKATLFLMRVPPASLNPLKDYAEKILQPRGIYPFAVVTRIGFDPTTAHPKLTFKAARFVNDEEAEAIVALRASEDVRRILAEATEYADTGTTAAAEGGSAAADATAAPASAASLKKRRAPTARPAEVEEATLPEEVTAEEAVAEESEEGTLSIEDLDAAAATPAADADDTEIGAAPPPKAAKPAAAKAAPKPAAVAKPAAKPAAARPAPAIARPAPAAAPKPAKAAPKPAPAAVPAAAAAESDDFEGMLDTILAD